MTGYSQQDFRNDYPGSHRNLDKRRRNRSWQASQILHERQRERVLQIKVHRVTPGIWNKPANHSILLPANERSELEKPCNSGCHGKKILYDNPRKTLQQAVNEASFAKNMQITAKGFLPFQLLWGRNPTIPGLSECTAGQSRMA